MSLTERGSGVQLRSCAFSNHAITTRAISYFRVEMNPSKDSVYVCVCSQKQRQANTIACDAFHFCGKGMRYGIDRSDVVVSRRDQTAHLGSIHADSWAHLDCRDAQRTTGDRRGPQPSAQTVEKSDSAPPPTKDSKPLA